jgi:hypothetical protein
LLRAPWPDRRNEIDDGGVDTVNVQQVLRPSVHRAGHHAERFFIAQVMPARVDDGFLDHGVEAMLRDFATYRGLQDSSPETTAWL